MRAQKHQNNNARKDADKQIDIGKHAKVPWGHSCKFAHANAEQKIGGDYKFPNK